MPKTTKSEKIEKTTKIRMCGTQGWKLCHRSWETNASTKSTMILKYQNKFFNNIKGKNTIMESKNKIRGTQV